MTLKLFWHGGKDNSINFGDTLSPLVVSRLTGREVRFADLYNCDMVAIGSILDQTVKRRWKRLARLRFSKIAVWGSGSFGSDTLEKHFGLDVLAVRGPMTRDKMNLPAGLPMGDPGLFANLFVSEKPAVKTARWGIIPHIIDRDLPIVRMMAESTPQSIVIDLTNPDIPAVCAQIASCDYIISSSLHGVIAADALGVPNVWMSLSKNVNYADWKFADYFKSVGREGLLPITPPANLSAIEDRAQNADRTIITTRRADLERAIAPLK